MNSTAHATATGGPAAGDGGSRRQTTASELELLTDQARQVIDMLLAAILTALGELDRIRLEPANRS